MASGGGTDRYRREGNWAALGKQTHARVLGRLKRSLGATLPGMGDDFEMTAGLEGYVQDEFRCEATTSSGVLVVAILDALVNDRVCVEIKSGSELRGRHVLQLMINCWVLHSDHGVDPEGVLYFKYSDRSYVLPNGGNAFWADGQKLCELAAKISDRQAKIDTKKAIIGTKRHGQRSMTRFESDVEWSASLVNPADNIKDRREFDEIIVKSLKPLCDLLVEG